MKNTTGAAHSHLLSTVLRNATTCSRDALGSRIVAENPSCPRCARTATIKAERAAQAALLAVAA
jgi:hypothetical protein